MLDWLGVHLPFIYMHCTRSSSRCSSMQGICVWLLGGPSAFGIYMCIDLSIYRSAITLDLAVKLIWCSSMQGIYAQLLGGSSASWSAYVTCHNRLHWYFLISWPFWMGSHWQHRSAKISSPDTDCFILGGPSKGMSSENLNSFVVLLLLHRVLLFLYIEMKDQ